LYLPQAHPARHHRGEIHHPPLGQADRPRVHLVHPPHHRDRQPLAPSGRGSEPDRVVTGDAGQHDPPARPDRGDRQPDTLVVARRLERHIHPVPGQLAHEIVAE